MTIQPFTASACSRRVPTSARVGRVTLPSPPPRFVLSALQCAGSALTPMPLSPATRLGHYEVTALLGEGGMGEDLPSRVSTHTATK